MDEQKFREEMHAAQIRIREKQKLESFYEYKSANMGLDRYYVDADGIIRDKLISSAHHQARCRARRKPEKPSN